MWFYPNSEWNNFWGNFCLFCVVIFGLSSSHRLSCNRCIALLGGLIPSAIYRPYLEFNLPATDYRFNSCFLNNYNILIYFY